MESLQFTGTQVVAYGALLAGLLLLGIVWARRRLRRTRPGAPSALLVKHRTKYPSADTWERSGTHFRIGLAVAVALSVLAINWTTFEEREQFAFGDLGLEELIAVAPPPTEQKPPPPPPPPPPPKEIVVEEDPVEEQPVFKDVSIDIDELVVAPPPVLAAPAPPPPPPPPPPMPKSNVEEIYLRAEQMPRFQGCAGITDQAAAKACSEQALFGFLRKQLHYPPIAKENGIQGTVTLQFVVEKDGSISDLVVARGQPAGLSEEAVRVTELMPDWEPGMQNGQPVRVKFTLPIRFKLQ